MSVPITNKIRMKEFTHPNAISQKTQGEYTFTVHWVGHVLKNIIELYPILKSNVVVLLKMLHLSLKPKIHNFKTTWVFFKIENGPNSGNAKSLYALAKFSFCKKVIENLAFSFNHYYCRNCKRMSAPAISFNLFSSRCCQL